MPRLLVFSAPLWCAIVNGCVTANPSFPDAEGVSGESTAGATTTEAVPGESQTEGSSTGDDSSDPFGECTEVDPLICDLSPPVGWGPVVTPVESGGLCPAGEPPVLEILVSASGLPASCSCSCGNPESVDCRAARFQYSDHPSCVAGNNPKVVVVADGTDCAQTAGAEPDIGLEVELVGGTGCYRSDSPCTEAPFCSPSQEVSVEPPLLETAAFCALDSIRCGDKDCVTSAFGPVCTYAFGDHACPDSFPERSTEFVDALDDRGCTECECGPATGIRCSAEVEWFHSREECESGAVPFATEQLLQDEEVCASDAQDGLGAAVLTEISVAEAGSCLPLGGAPTGRVSADPDSVVTVCCTG